MPNRELWLCTIDTAYEGQQFIGIFSTVENAKYAAENFAGKKLKWIEKPWRIQAETQRNYQSAWIDRVKVDCSDYF